MEPTILQAAADARLHADPLGVGALCTRIVMIVRTEGVDPMVMGARGRPRWAERAFGGCARTLLSELAVATFTAH